MMIPPRNNRYKDGAMVPRHFRTSRALWDDFALAAEKRGYTASELLRYAMEQIVAPFSTFALPGDDFPDDR